MSAADLDVRIVGQGVDGMAFNVDGWLDGAAYSLLDDWRSAAALAEERHGLPVVVEWAGRSLTMHSTGARGGWRYVLRSDDYRVLVRPAPRVERRSGEEHVVDLVMQVQASAEWCWREGHRAVAEAVEEWVSAVGVRDLSLHLGRVDLCVDFQADVDLATPTCPLDKTGAWVTTAALTRADHRRGQRWNGSTWGKRPGLLVRLYDKTTEIRTASRKTWFRSVWERSGCYDPKRPVLRLEVAVPRSVLRDCERGRAASPAAWWPRLPALWRRTLRRTLRLATATRDTHRDRWPTHPLWRVLSERPMFGEVAMHDVVPVAASGAEVRRAMAGVVGYLRLLAVASGVPVEDLRTDPEAVMAACAILMREFPAYWQSYQRRTRALVTWRETVADRRALAGDALSPRAAGET